MAGGCVVLRRLIVPLRLIALLVAFLLFGGAPASRAAAGSGSPDGSRSPAGLEWAAAWGANPALVACQPLDLAGQLALASAWRSLSPLDADFLASYAVPDTGYGAAAATLRFSRLPEPNATATAGGFGYTWGRRWSQRLAGGLTIHWEQQQTQLAAGFSTPAEQGWGGDLGGLYLPDEQTWLGLAVLDVGGTVLRSSGSSDSRPPTLQVLAGRHVSPALTLAVRGDDALEATPEGARWRGEVRLVRGSTVWRAGVGAGARFGWALGLAAGDRPCRLDLGVEGWGEATGATLGVTFRW